MQTWTPLINAGVKAYACYDSNKLFDWHHLARYLSVCGNEQQSDEPTQLIILVVLVI